MAEIEPQDHAQGDRRAFIRKGLIVGGVVAATPLVSTFQVPAGAQAGSNPIVQSLSFSFPAYANANTSTVNGTKDATGAAIESGTNCTLAGYVSGQSSTYGGTVTATRVKNNNDESTSITISGLPEGTGCSISALARCGPDGGGGACFTGTATKPPAGTTVSFQFSGACALDTGFRKLYLTVAC